jgi:RimJ/RimL family protein N-acetyltransferase
VGRVLSLRLMTEDDLPAVRAWLGLPHVARWGIDYAIGEPARVGQGHGTELIAALVAEVRRRYPGAGILTGPDASNVASRRVLGKNGFRLVAVRPVVTEPSDAPMAVYRL